MLPQEQIKERLSKRIIQAIANSNGFEAESFENDWGIDLRIKKIIARIKPDGKLRYQDSTQGINVQLKATTKKNIINSNGYISYKLKVDNYNDMVKDMSNMEPIFLFLVILPDDQSQWISISNDDLILKSNCYWYNHPDGTSETTNKDKKVIKIPESQEINLGSIDHILDLIYN